MDVFINSIRPRRTHIDTETSLQPFNTTSYHSSTKYSLFGPSYENSFKKDGPRDARSAASNQDGIYEVLDRDEARLSEEKTGMYNKLKFEDQV